MQSDGVLQTALIGERSVANVPVEYSIATAEQKLPVHGIVIGQVSWTRRDGDHRPRTSVSWLIFFAQRENARVEEVRSWCSRDARPFGCRRPI